MAFTAGNAIDRAKRRLRIYGDSAFDTEFLEWVNDFHAIFNAEMQLINKGFTEVTGYVDTVANQYLYTIPSNIIVVNSVKYLYNGIYYDIQEWPFLKTDDYHPTTPLSSIISGWFFNGNQIELRGAPSAATVNGLQFKGYPDSTDSASTATSIAWHNHVRLCYTLYLCKSYMDGDRTAEVNRWDAEYERQMDVLRKIAAGRYTGQHDIGYEVTGEST